MAFAERREQEWKGIEGWTWSAETLRALEHLEIQAGPHLGDIEQEWLCVFPVGQGGNLLRALKVPVKPVEDRGWEKAAGKTLLAQGKTGPSAGGCFEAEEQGQRKAALSKLEGKLSRF